MQESPSRLADAVHTEEDPTVSVLSADLRENNAAISPDTTIGEEGCHHGRLRPILTEPEHPPHVPVSYTHLTLPTTPYV